MINFKRLWNWDWGEKDPDSKRVLGKKNLMSLCISASVLNTSTSTRLPAITSRNWFWMSMRSTRDSVRRQGKSPSKTCRWRRLKQLLGGDQYHQFHLKFFNQLANNKTRIFHNPGSLLSNSKEEAAVFLRSSNRITLLSRIRWDRDTLGRVRGVSLTIKVLKLLPLHPRRPK